jgi:hypothetical protein
MYSRESSAMAQQMQWNPAGLRWERIREAWQAHRKGSLTTMFTPNISRLEVIIAMTFLGVLFFGASLVTGS